MKYGYHFKIYEGYLFKQENVFTKFINKLYEMKSNSQPNTPHYLISKLLMNSLYGRFGLNPENEKSCIISGDEVENYLSKHINVDLTIFEQSENVLVTHIEDSEESLSIKNISVSISSAIAAYGRIEMSKYMEMFSEDLVSIDTDGIKLTRDLPKEMISDKELGKMKFEYILEEGVFPAPKVYGGLILKGEKQLVEMVKVKGYKNVLSYYELKSVLNKNHALKLYHDKVQRRLDLSTIIIMPTPYLLSITENKRSLEYDIFGNYIKSHSLYVENGKIKRIVKNPTNQLE